MRAAAQASKLSAGARGRARREQVPPLQPRGPDSPASWEQKPPRGCKRGRLQEEKEGRGQDGTGREGRGGEGRGEARRGEEEKRRDKPETVTYSLKEKYSRKGNKNKFLFLSGGKKVNKPPGTQSAPA